MISLFVAWQARDASRAWFPVGRLDFEPERQQFSFEYTRGVERAQLSGFTPLVSFPRLHDRYESDALFPLFKNRVMSPNRPDFAEYVQSLALSPTPTPSQIEVLAVSGGERQTDSLELFPKIELKADRSFKTRFFLHGTRHLNEPSQSTAAQLKEGEELRIALETNNPATGLALQVQSQEYQMIGWCPRYLLDDFVRSFIAQRCALQARVVQVNAAQMSQERRVLVELTGCYPEGNEPMDGDEYKPIRPSH